MNDEKEVVHCKTKKEWDFVKSKCKQDHAIAREPWSKGKLEEYPEGIAISIEDNSYCGLNWWSQQEYKILSFEEWCSKYNYQPDSICKFEKGKYYYFESYYKKYPNIARLDTNENNYFISDSWIMLKNKPYNSQGTWSFSIISNVREASLQEVQKYLPKGHPDLIVETQFKKGDYIVQLIDGGCTEGQFKINHCYKQKEPMNVLRPVLDSKMIKDNGWDIINFNNKSTWRYATSKEIEEYNRRGKPYDTNELNLKDVKLDYKGRPLKEFKVGSWYTNPSHKKCPEGGVMRIKSVEIIAHKPISERSGYYYKIYFDATRTKEGKIEKYDDYQANSDLEQKMEEVDFEDNFVLPKKWCIEVTIDNKEILEDWRGHPIYSDIGSYMIEGNNGAPIKRGYIFLNRFPEGYTKITFEQFKKYVLKEKDKSYPFYFQVPPYDLQKYNEIGHRDVIKSLAKGNSTLTPKIYTKPTENKTFKKISLIKTKSI